MPPTFTPPRSWSHGVASGYNASQIIIIAIGIILGLFSASLISTAILIFSKLRWRSVVPKKSLDSHEYNMSRTMEAGNVVAYKHGESAFVLEDKGSNCPALISCSGSTIRPDWTRSEPRSVGAIPVKAAKGFLENGTQFPNTNSNPSMLGYSGVTDHDEHTAKKPGSPSSELVAVLKGLAASSRIRRRQTS